MRCDRVVRNRKSLLYRYAALLLLGVCPLAHAGQFGLQLAGAAADRHDIQKLDLGLVWDPGLNWWDTGDWHFSLVGEVHLAYWHTHGAHPAIYEAGVAPMLRFIKDTGSVRPYVELGAGLRVLSHARVSDAYTLSSAFQFTEIIGVGAQFGRRQQYQVGLRYQHISNADIKQPNPGIDFTQLYVQYNF
ncbi:acyloxyacyl hydrolase [Candidimonas nitroreducens]|uniref:Lipid A deacylase n=1 Tax=Candidimonas nitroreducens TaxID=683354 RepID=A0A225MB08_9BURK|nr:acyloxyacyl hydrolase [Candidimonas nitroreducens]OWT58396.1 acyloxyacyl hydrolase [Candidimonas nitroreducens]